MKKENIEKSELQHPAPPFVSQEQPAPGIETIMEPIPDHGEKSYIGHGRLKNKVVLLTGGDSGIGKAVAIAMAREGADIVIGYKDDMEDVDAINTLEWVEMAGRRGILIKGDIREESFCNKMIAIAVEEFGKIDILINNAAYQMSYNDIEEITAEEWNKTFEVNLSAMFYLTKRAKRHMPKGSSIINTTSVNAYSPNPSLLPYAASKAAIQNFTSNLAFKFMQDESAIRVNAVAPGPVWTPLIPSTIPNHEEFGNQSPIGRPAQPVEIAYVYVFLASREASYISGATIPVTGGMLTL